MLKLPFPPKALSPNEQSGWRAMAAVKKAYRWECFIEAKHQGFGRHTVLGDGRIDLEMWFYRPRKDHYDHDNLIARMKSGLDGVADALGIDDARFRVTGGGIDDETGGYVTIEFKEERT